MPTALGCLDFIRHRRLSVAGGGADEICLFVESIAAGDPHVAIVEGGFVNGFVIGIGNVEAVRVAAAGGGGEVRDTSAGSGDGGIWGGFFDRDEFEIIHSRHFPDIEDSLEFDGISGIDRDSRRESAQHEILSIGARRSQLLVESPAIEGITTDAHRHWGLTIVFVVIADNYLVGARRTRKINAGRADVTIVGNPN